MNVQTVAVGTQLASPDTGWQAARYWLLQSIAGSYERSYDDFCEGVARIWAAKRKEMGRTVLSGQLCCAGTDTLGSSGVIV